MCFCPPTACTPNPGCCCVALQGYLPRDLYDLNSKFGTEAELRDAISVFHEQVACCAVLCCAVLCCAVLRC